MARASRTSTTTPVPVHLRLLDAYEVPAAAAGTRVPLSFPDHLKAIAHEQRPCGDVWRSGFLTGTEMVSFSDAPSRLYVLHGVRLYEERPRHRRAQGSSQPPPDTLSCEGKAPRVDRRIASPLDLERSLYLHGMHRYVPLAVIIPGAQVPARGRVGLDELTDARYLPFLAALAGGRENLERAIAALSDGRGDAARTFRIDHPARMPGAAYSQVCTLPGMQGMRCTSRDYAMRSAMRCLVHPKNL